MSEKERGEMILIFCVFAVCEALLLVTWLVGWIITRRNNFVKYALIRQAQLIEKRLQQIRSETGCQNAKNSNY